MANVEFSKSFRKKVKKIKDKLLQEKVKKQIEKIIASPDIGKPMRYDRKETRKLHISPYRLAYTYFEEKNELVFLELYHKDEQ